MSPPLSIPLSQCVSDDDCKVLLSGGGRDESQSRCELPKGTWSSKKLETEHTVANGYCYDKNDNEPTMTGNAARKTYGRVCGTAYDWEDGTGAGKCWENVAPDGVATDELTNGRETNKVQCEAPVHTWTDSTGVCSDAAFTDKLSCTTKGTWSQCSNTNFKDSDGCTNTDFTWYGLGNNLVSNCYVKKGGTNAACRNVINPNSGSCSAASASSNEANKCVYTSGSATLIPLTANYQDTDINAMSGTTSRNLWYKVDVRYGFYGPNSCESCPSGLSIWSLDPNDHASTSNCKTCPKGYVGLSSAASCSTCSAGKFDSRTSAQQTRTGDFKTCSGLTGDDACDSSVAENW